MNILAHADGIAWDEMLLISVLVIPLIGLVGYVVSRALQSNRR